MISNIIINYYETDLFLLLLSSTDGYKYRRHSICNIYTVVKSDQLWPS